MKIILLRHGRPIIPSLEWLNSISFKQWVHEYNASGLDPSSTPESKAFKDTLEYQAIVCSKLPRSIESAHILGKERIVLTHEVFNEAGLPIADWHILKLSPKIWAVFFRVLWLFGYSNNSESFNEAKIRAKDAVKKLIDIADKYESVLLVGHGVYNRILANELRYLGWSGPKNPGSKYWDTGTYVYK